MIWHLVGKKLEDPTVCCNRTSDEMDARNPANDGHGATARVATCNCPGLDPQHRARLQAKEKPIPPFFSLADEQDLICDFLDNITETMLSYEKSEFSEARKWAAGMAYWAMAGMLKALGNTMYITVPQKDTKFLGSCRYLEEKARSMGLAETGEYLVDRLRNKGE